MMFCMTQIALSSELPNAESFDDVDRLLPRNVKGVDYWTLTFFDNQYPIRVFHKDSTPLNDSEINFLGISEEKSPRLCIPIVSNITRVFFFPIRG